MGVFAAVGTALAALGIYALVAYLVSNRVREIGIRLALGERSPTIFRWFAATNRLRTEGSDHLLAAAEANGVSNFIAQSYGAWNGIREGGWIKTEDDPVDLWEGTVAHSIMAAAHYVEEEVGKAGVRRCVAAGSTGRVPPTASSSPYASSNSR